MKRWRVAGINFDHMHMGDNLRVAHETPGVELVGVCDEDPSRTEDSVRKLGVPADRVFSDVEDCLERTRPDLVILCPHTGGHAEWVARVARPGLHVMMEKPFAASVADADRMIAAMDESGGRLAINWPLLWVQSHRTAHRLLQEGAIGELIEVHYYDGNRGPLWHIADKDETTAEFVEQHKPTSWWYQQASGGGSLLDYLGYGATLGTWFHDGRAPIEVTSVVDEPAGLEVDEHSVTVARYETGLSKMETRWGTFTDPWVHQPQPRCGFVLVGRDGTISSDDYAEFITLQTRENPQGRQVPADELRPPHRNAIESMLHSIETGEEMFGPLSTTISRTGQRIVDAAARSAREKRTIELSETE